MKLLSAIILVWLGSVFGITIYSIRDSPNECNMRDYQLDITDTGTHIYRGKTEIGFVPFDSTSQYDKLFLKDNL